MNFPLDSHTTTDIKPEMFSGVQIGNGIPRDTCNIHGTGHSRTNRKDNILMHRRLAQIFTYILEWGQGTCTLTKYTRCWTYSALQVFFVNLWEISDFSLGQEKGRYQKKQVGTWAYKCIYLVKFILLILTVENIEPLWVYGWQHSSYNLQMPTRPPARVRTLLNESFSLPPPLPYLKGSKRYYIICSSCFGLVK